VRALPPPLSLAACALLAGALFTGALFAAPQLAGPVSTIQILDDCLARLAPEAAPGTKAPSGIGELRLVCPDLEHAIVDSDLNDQLPENWQQQLNRSAIADLSWQLHRYQSKSASAAPRVPTLYQVAHTLNQPQPRHGWWQDFKDWLRQLLLTRTSPAPSFLNRWWSRLSPSQLLMRSMLYGLLGAIIVMALWIVRRELQAARAGAGAAKRALQRSLRLPSAAAEEAPSVADIDRAPLAERPAVLLRLLVQALLQSGRLRSERSLTHRELGVRGAFDDPEQQLRFVRISLLAERLLYGASLAAISATAQPQIDQALTDGRQLYAQLLAGRADAR
jgi:hypothetical protein